MSRYPHLPQALHHLLEAGPWEGTPTQLYEALHSYRAEPWPATPVALSLWLRNHGEEHGITSTSRHDGTRRLLRLVRTPNGLVVGEVLGNNGTFSADTWEELRSALPHWVCGSEPVTLVVQVRDDLRVARVCYPADLAQVVNDKAALYPSPLRLWLVRGAVSLTEWARPTRPVASCRVCRVGVG